MDTSTVARSFFEKMAANQYRQAFDLLADDVKYTIIGSTPLSGAYDGRKDLERRLLPGLARFRAPPDIRIKEYIVQDDRAVVITSGVGEGPYGPYRQDPAIFVLRIRDDRITELLEFIDTVMLETMMFGKTLVPAEA